MPTECDCGYEENIVVNLVIAELFSDYVISIVCVKDRPPRPEENSGLGGFLRQADILNPLCGLFMSE